MAEKYVKVVQDMYDKQYSLNCYFSRKSFVKGDLKRNQSYHHHDLAIYACVK